MHSKFYEDRNNVGNYQDDPKKNKRHKSNDISTTRRFSLSMRLNVVIVPPPEYIFVDLKEVKKYHKLYHCASVAAFSSYF